MHKRCMRWLSRRNAQTFIREQSGMNEFSADSSQTVRPSCPIILTISARDLRDVDSDTYSDPFCVISVGESDSRRIQWTQKGHTEVINNCLNPDWATKITITYYFEEKQYLLFEVYDRGLEKEKTLLGSARLLLHEIVTAKYNRKTAKLLYNEKHHGYLIAIAEKQSEGRRESLYVVCSATKLDRKDFLGKCDPFLKISRINHDNSQHLAHRTRYHEQNLNPKWKPFEVHLDQLCYNDKNREFLVECYDWDNDGNHDLVGSCTTTVNRLINGIDVALPLINEKKARKNKKYEDSGQLHFDFVHCWMDYTFLDFIYGGTELKISIAIDFTKSNKIQCHPSLHQPDESKVNQYEVAIMAVAEICRYYNKSRIFHAYGFGAKLPHDQLVHYNFPLNTETNKAECHDVDELLEAYRIAVKTVELAGPTDFAPTIRFAARQAASYPSDGSQYSVFLIITDGVITDMAKTKHEIVKASSLPLSVIIIGIGYDSFDDMKILDSDRKMLNANGKFAKRDIVQFVQLREYLPPHRSLTTDDLVDAKVRLAKEVLREVPDQLTGYMKSKGIIPRPAELEENIGSEEHWSSNFSRDSSSLNRMARRQLPACPQ